MSVGDNQSSFIENGKQYDGLPKEIHWNVLCRPTPAITTIFMLKIENNYVRLPKVMYKIHLVERLSTPHQGPSIVKVSFTTTSILYYYYIIGDHLLDYLFEMQGNFD